MVIEVCIQFFLVSSLTLLIFRLAVDVLMAQPEEVNVYDSKSGLRLRITCN